MNAAPRTPPGGTGPRPPRSPRRPASGTPRGRSAPAGSPLVALDALRIERALQQRSRYKYVQPRVEAEGQGWKVVSPNCSRNIDPAGGEIDIAWLVPAEPGPHDEPGSWRLFSREHEHDRWRLEDVGSLPALLARLCEDPQRRFWR